MSEPDYTSTSTKAPVQGPSQAKAPSPKRKSTPDDARIEVLRASLLAAQHWLDHAALVLGTQRAKATKTVDAKHTIAVVEGYFKDAIVTLMDGGAEMPRTQLGPQMDETSRALAEFLEEVLFGNDPATNNGAATEGLFQKEKTLRHLLLLPDAPRRSRHKKALQPRDRYEAQAATPLFGLIRSDAQQALAKLREGGDRDDVIGGLADSLGAHLDQARSILERHPKQQVGRFRQSIEDASRAIINVYRWISPRPNSSTQTALFAPIVAKTDGVRSIVGLASILETELAESTRDRDSAASENSSVSALEKELAKEVAERFTGFELGAARFLKFAELKDPAPSPSFSAELAKGILISVLGNVAGAGLGRLFVEAISGTASDSIQSIVGKAADGALAKTAGENEATRDRQLFSEGLILSQAQIVSDSATAIAERIHNKSISANELQRMLAHVTSVPARQILELAFQGTCHGYALLKSQSRIGTKVAPGSRVVSKVGSSRDYFGAVPNTLGTTADTVSERAGLGGRPPARVGGVQGSTGIARLTVVPDLSGPLPASFEIHGMNREVAIGVLQHAHGQPSALALMLEVHFSVQPTMSIGPLGPTVQHKRTPIIVIDEAGTLVHAIDWESLQLLAKMSPLYASPANAWAAIRNQNISPALARSGWR